MTRLRMGYDWEDGWLPEGKWIDYPQAMALTWNLSDRLGLSPVRVCRDVDFEDEDGLYPVAGYCLPEERTIGYPGTLDPDTNEECSITEGLVLHEVAHLWRYFAHPEAEHTEDEHGPLFLALLLSLHRHHSPGWWAEVEGTDMCPIKASAVELGFVPPFVHRQLPPREVIR